ncbi:unnamed protein product [Closterium sp. NIES-54]
MAISSWPTTGTWMGLKCWMTCGGRARTNLSLFFEDPEATAAEEDADEAETELHANTSATHEEDAEAGAVDAIEEVTEEDAEKGTPVAGGGAEWSDADEEWWA